ncbi:P-loop containing nucleoside triphosphate hydrolase protein [Mycena amicta]|nr:P-loop containing nucleoside triphosphate hydrolase protein [Mycena amicta]
MSLVLSHVGLNRTTITRRLFSGLRFTGAEFLASAQTPDRIPSLLGEPEVVVVGRANGGKSTLCNMLVGRNRLVMTSRKPGGTKSLKFFRVQITAGHQTRPIVLVDAPGYGARGRVEWGELFNHYIEERKQLRRVYICFNAKHMLNDVDLGMLEYLSAASRDRWTIQPILTKIDTLPLAKANQHILQMHKQIQSVAAASIAEKPFVTSLVQGAGSLGVGVETVRRDLAQLCSLLATKEGPSLRTNLKFNVDVLL